MSSGRSDQTDTIKESSIRTLIPPRDPGALSGTLAGVSFVRGVAGAMALVDAPDPRPGSEPAEIRRYFRGSSGAARLSVVGQLISAAAGLLSPLYFVWEPAAWLIAAGRFSGLLVSGIVGVRLGRRSG